VSATAAATDPQRIAVVDLGSNSFRLVVFHYQRGRWFRMVDEIREPVRMSAGADETGIRPDALARAEAAARLYAAYCDAVGVDTIDAVATSAVRDAANQAEVIAALSAGGLPVRVLTSQEEARYGYLGVVNGTSLRNGWFLDIGGGSLQLGRLDDRLLTRAMSRPLGAVRLTEAFLTGDQTSKSELRALRRHVEDTLAAVEWLAPGGNMVGVGGAIRTLSIMDQRRKRHPVPGPSGYRLTRAALAEIEADLVALPVSERSRLSGLKPDRADIILAGAVAIGVAMDRLDMDRIEVCGYGLREGVFYEHYLAPDDPPLLADVRRTAVLNATAHYEADRAHADHVTDLALAIFDGTAQLGLHGGDRGEREILWAASMLHDIGVAIDYSAHQRHSEYLVLNSGLPGFDHREVALIATLVRGHRKGIPSLEPMASLLRDDDDKAFLRCAACLRLAEQLDRARAGQVASLICRPTALGVEIAVEGTADPSLSLWSAAAEASVFERAFGRPLTLTA
jgi:exopolyphosphatase / guanosine-5'-triphosphate,3'-diphosphate pyrophosphatase